MIPGLPVSPSMRTFGAALLLCGLMLSGGRAQAQRAGAHQAPPRPALWEGADPNSASAYFTHGMARLETAPREAAAFYWAGRLDPTMAQAFYARRIAFLLSDPGRLVGYMEGSRRVRLNPEVQAIDSLQLRALSLDPFLYPSLDRLLMRNYLRTVFYDVTRDAEFASYQLVDELMGSRNPAFRASLAASEGRLAEAIAEYEKQVGRVRREDRARVRAEMGRLHFLAGDLEKSAQNLGAALEALRAQEGKDLVFVYESKAVMEFTLGAVKTRAGDAAAAREAYGRALTEDLAFAPAHVRLSELALAAGDTAAALAEMALAVDLAPADPAQRYSSALLLVKAGRGAEAEAELKKAVELEPYFAAPRFLLAALHDRAGMADEALEHYRAFLERAARNDPQRPRAAARVAALEAAARAPAAETP